MVTERDIIEGLTSLGIKRGDELEVHSSLRSFGVVDGGTETVIAALQKVCTAQGSLFMPALRLSREMELSDADRALGIVSKIKILPANRDRSAMGSIADTFRKQPDVVTGDGVFAISGWGRNASKAAETGLEYVIHNGGKALLLGVDIGNCKALCFPVWNVVSIYERALRTDPFGLYGLTK